MKTKKWIAVLAVAGFCGTAQARDALTTLAAAPGAAEKRSALVIGNSGYASGGLKNPLNDARAVARELSVSGFDVLLLEDGTQAGIQRAIRRFGDSLHQGGVGLFYYAGHGMQVKGRNFMVPVNADIDREYEVEYTSVDVSMVLAMMDAAKNPLNIVILDACRNNPFARSLRVGTSGLAPLDAPAGTFIAFATSPGAIASDGAGDNGVYTKHLLAHLGKPGLPIEQLFKQVRIGVMAETRGEQTPWESSSLRGDFAFRPGMAVEEHGAQRLAEALQRERDAHQRDTAALIQAALERQRLEYREQATKITATPLEVAVPPITAASVADRWAYRLHGARSRSGIYAADAADLSAYLVRLDGQLTTGRRSSVARIDGYACSARYLCTMRGRVVARELVTVEAGTFEAVKVMIEQKWQPSSVEPGASSINAEMWGSRVITVWYSEEAGRPLKISSRLTHGRHPPMDANFEVELARVQPSTGAVASRGQK